VRAYCYGVAFGVGVVAGWACHEVIDRAAIRAAWWLADAGVTVTGGQAPRR
jgi:hypothetical protein